MYRFAYPLILFLLAINTSPLLAQCELTIAPVESEGCMHSVSEVVYTDLYNAAFDGHTLTKTSNSNGWNAGAFSTAPVFDNGGAQLVIGQTGKRIAFGLSHDNEPVSNDINGIEYGFDILEWGFTFIRESGSLVSWGTFYSIGDTMKILVENGQVNYYLNSSLIYASSSAPDLPLYVDVSLKSANSEISDVTILNKTEAVIRAFHPDNTQIPAYQWYRNNQLLPEISAELTLASFSNGDLIECRAYPTSGSCSGSQIKSNRMILQLDEENIPSSTFLISNDNAEQGCLLAEENVHWQTNTPDNIEINGNSVIKTDGWSTSDAGFYSENKVSDNGYLRFRVADLYSRKMLGLSHQNNGNSESGINFAFYIEWGGSLRVYENGTWRGQYGNVSTSDILRISVEDGKVRYYKNEELLYLSSTSPTLPLIVDGTMQSSGSAIADARIANVTQGNFSAIVADTDAAFIWEKNGIATGQQTINAAITDLAPGDFISSRYISTVVGCGNYELKSDTIHILPRPQTDDHIFFIEGMVDQSGVGEGREEVVWDPASLQNVSNINNTLTKIQGYNQYNAGGSSLNTVKNNGYFEYTATASNSDLTIGLSHSDAGYHYNSTDYAMVLQTNGRYTIYESGSWRKGNIPYAAGDVLRISVENGVVKYFKNDGLVYTSSASPTLPMLVDVSLKAEGTSVGNVIVGNVNDRTFVAHFSGLGPAPILDWQVNGNSTGIQGTHFYWPQLNNADIVTCQVTPDYPACYASNGFESNEIQFTGPVIQSNWLGGMSSDWHMDGNWTNGVPNADISAYIPYGRPNDPKIEGIAEVKNLYTDPDVKVKVANNQTLIVYGDLEIHGSLKAQKANITFLGDADREIFGNEIIIGRMTVNMSAGAKIINLHSDVEIRTEVLLLRGKIRTGSHAVVYLRSSLSRAGNPESFIEGTALKIGNEAFLFPVGRDTVYAPVEISAPQHNSDAFAVTYYRGDPGADGYDTGEQDGTMSRISTCEYWLIDRVEGQSAVTVSLSYENARSCGTSEPGYLQVAHWDGEKWENKGGTNLDGDSNQGTITSSGPVSDFSPFTLASLSKINPLPIELSSFQVNKTSSHEAELTWQTQSERNNARFGIERSTDAVHFYEIGNVAGAGTSHSTLKYNFTDSSPDRGINYYRLTQTDFDGTKTVFEVRSLKFDQPLVLSVFPNPGTGRFTVQKSTDHSVEIFLKDAQGKTHWHGSLSEMYRVIDVTYLPGGIYFLEVHDNEDVQTLKVIIH